MHHNHWTQPGAQLRKPDNKKQASSSTILRPSELFYTTKASDNCHISQTDFDHYKSNKRHAVDVACGFGRAEVYAPDFRDNTQSYKVTVFKSDVTGDTIDLAFSLDGTEYFWRIGHVETKLKTGDTTTTGRRIWQMNLSGITTGYHSHIELWVKTGKEFTNIDYTTRSQAINNFVTKKFPKRSASEEYYFTHYDLWDVSQNDSSPCHGASSKNLCDLEKKWTRTMALTADVRAFANIKFGDKVQLKGDAGCAWIYEVHDEMNSRYRYSDIKRNWAPIKGDLPSMPGWKCSVTKL